MRSLFRQQESSKLCASEAAILRLYQKFNEFGTVHDLPRSGRPKISEKESTEKICEILAENSSTTLTRLSAQTNLSKTTCWRRLKNDLNLFAYKIQICQQLFEEDYDRRVEMAEILAPILKNPRSQYLVYFSDEAIFHVSGRVHKQNCRIWASEKPMDVGEEPLHSPKVNVWCAISRAGIIGPYFFDEATVTGATSKCLATTSINSWLERALKIQ